MDNENQIPKYVPQEDDDSGSPLVDALNNFFRGVPALHDPAEVQAFIKNVEGLPDADAQIEKFILGIAARYEKWHRENGSEQS
jgi:hypothetical protein